LCADRTIRFSSALAGLAARPGKDGVKRDQPPVGTLGTVTDPAGTDSERTPQGPSFTAWMGSLWGYTLLRFGMFFALWGILVLVGLAGLFAALVALVLSVPLSLVLLSGPRARVAEQMQRRVEAARASRHDLDSRLDPKHDDD
jgi:Protein of unknown function (DUF4229)